jgi:large subunit ribosomal protein L9
MSTRIILRSDIDKLGKRGDIVEVSDGHFRNYLRPRGLAIVATDGAVSQAAAMRRARDLRDAHDREGAQTVASALVAKTITIPVKAGGEGRLYGSVTADQDDGRVPGVGQAAQRRRVPGHGGGHRPLIRAVHNPRAVAHGLCTPQTSEITGLHP